MRPHSTHRLRTPAAGLLAAATILALCAAITAPFAAGGDRPPRGPVVAIPDCHVVSQGCGIDPESPDLSPAGCATALAGQLSRRGITSRLMGPVEVSCGPGSNAIVAEVSLTATCGGGSDAELPVARAKAADLWAELILRDCSTGEVVGRAKTRREMSWQRRTVMRDLTEELGHHLSERKIRKSHPGTPISWMRGDVGGEHSFEFSGGLIDVERNAFNDFLADAGGDREKNAFHGRIELAFHPVANPGFRAAVGVDALGFKTTTRGDVTGDMVGAGAGASVTNARITMDIGVVGVRGSIGYGWNITRNQSAGAEIGGGYYLLGKSLYPAEIRIENFPGGDIRLREGNFGFSSEIRYEWRFTPHLAFTAGGGWTRVAFTSVNVVDRNRNLPFDIEFTGATARAGIAGRF